MAVTLRWWIGGPGWQGLLTALVGLVVAGTLVWTVRIVASLALQQEAMGFGDVTLMGMIGTFIGWQPAILAFFLAPFAGAIIALCQWLLTGRKDIAYGPFLCLSSLLVIVFWAAIWSGWGLPVFSLGVFLPCVLAACLALLGLLLLLLQSLKAAWLVRPRLSTVRRCTGFWPTTARAARMLAAGRSSHVARHVPELTRS